MRENLLSAARILVPILLALVVGGIILMLLGKDPIAYYWYVVRRGLLSWNGFQATLVRTAPLLFLAAGLIVAFRAGIWNLGIDGQFLLAAVIVAALGPILHGNIPNSAIFFSCFVVAAIVGAAWSMIPAYLKANHGINEIITTLMMTFLGISLANVLIKIPFNDPSTTVPQTATLAVEDRLPRSMTWLEIVDCAAESTRITAQILIIVATAAAFSWLLTVQGVPQQLVAWIAEIGVEKWSYMLSVNLLLLFLGCLIDPASAILILTPILLPLAESFGIDPIHFGIIMTVNLSIGMFTPPFGLNIFVAQSTTGESIGRIYLGVMPFVGVYLVGLILVVISPSISLWMLDW